MKTELESFARHSFYVGGTTGEELWVKLKQIMHLYLQPDNTRLLHLAYFIGDDETISNMFSIELSRGLTLFDLALRYGARYLVRCEIHGVFFQGHAVHNAAIPPLVLASLGRLPDWLGCIDILLDMERSLTNDIRRGLPRLSSWSGYASGTVRVLSPKTSSMSTMRLCGQYV